jgi:hypothetical protein
LTREKRIAIWSVFGLAVVAATVVLVISFRRTPYERVPEILEGAVIMQSPNPHRQTPVANATITATAAGYTTTTQSNLSGYFRLPLAREWRAGENVTLTFRARNFRPLEATLAPNGELFVARLAPVVSQNEPATAGGQVTVANVRTRYTTPVMTTRNIGSVAPTMDVPNTGNVPCEPGERPCSPDGRWKATIASKTLDAGPENQFVNTRVSCIAGPCPFTQIEDTDFTRPARVITIRVRNWSDTTTYLIEAEVSRTQQANYVREAFPAIFGQSMTFTLPPGAQGLSIEAEMNGHPIVFPVGPELRLSWATCSVENEREGAKLFRCELKDGYTFSQQSVGS